MEPGSQQTLLVQERGIRRRGADFLTIRGQVLPVKDEPEASDEEGDDEAGEELEFLDAEEIEVGALQIQSLAPSTSKVKIKAEDSKEYIVTGFFPLLDPWWCVTVDVKPSHSQYFAKGFPSYELEDDMLGKDSILPLFLKACNVPDDFRRDFLDWMPHYPPATFSGLMELAEDFKTDCNKDIACFLNGSGPGRFVLQALEMPLILKYLTKLLPRKVKYLLRTDTKDLLQPKLDLLASLENLLSTTPWKIGFSSVLFRELKLTGCEAKWDSFLQCENLLGQIPNLQLNALILYNELKRRCMDLGDTYVEEPDLTRAVFRDMSSENAWEALRFLEEEAIVVREQKRIFLYNYYQYEVNISEYVKRLAMKETWTQVDEKDVFDSTASKEQDISNENVGIHESESTDQDSSLEQLKSLQIKKDSHCSKKLDAEQKKAVKMILRNPVTVISGKGGCGKTTVVSLVFRTVIQKENEEVEAACQALENDDMSDEWVCHAMVPKAEQRAPVRVLLTAPTGKAASLLKKKTELPAATLHQITCSYSTWKKNELVSEESGKENPPWKFSKVEALVVDEGSLASVRMFSAVLELLFKHAKLAKLVILGDVRQLPSIEPGNMLGDMFGALCRLNWAIELQTNHRAESQLIVDNATWISQQKDMEFDAVVHFDGTSHTEIPGDYNKCILVSLAGPTDLSTAIIALLKDGPGLKDDRHSQFIAFRRKDCLLINELCCRHYAKHTVKNSKNQYEYRFQDKVCCTKNVYVKDLVTNDTIRMCSRASALVVAIRRSVWLRQWAADNAAKKALMGLPFTGLRLFGDCLDSVAKGGYTKLTLFYKLYTDYIVSVRSSKESVCNSQSPVEETQPDADHILSGQVVDDDDRICNGEIFYITNDVERDKIRELTISDGEDRTYTLNYKALRIRAGMRHAWARTIHTFQGSEEDTVVYVLGSAGRQNWKHVYTAVTRGRKRVYIIARRDQLDQAIAKKARERRTRLQQRLKDKLHQSSEPQPASSSSANTINPARGEDEPDLKPDLYTQPYTQIRSPVRYRCPPVLTTPDCTLSRNSCVDGDNDAHHVMTTPPGSSVTCDSPLQGKSSAQKRIGITGDDMGTPSKMQCSTVLYFCLSLQIMLRDWKCLAIYSIYTSRNRGSQWARNLTDISPTNLTGIESLSISVSCNKRLFKP
ncbi:DNA helicase B [Gastrophryne carolinensis]